MAVVVSQAAGCIITSGGEEYATITANWSLKQEATGQTLACPPGITTATIYSQPVDTAFQPVGRAILDLHDCNDNAGRTDPLPPDVYQVWIELTNGSGGTVYARSLSAFVDVIDVDKTFSTTILNDGGYFQFDWNLVDAATNAPMRCSDEPAIANIVAASMSSTTNFVDTRFPCSDGTGITKGMVAGNYTVEFRAEDSAARPLSPAPTVRTGTILDLNRVTDLGSITVRVN
ncbi:MAG: hypothetical protein H0T42_10200 [Deltaproteobacteria bacterium]|nr:hypothetical protein [Deltaproteobacteria bacterium]